MIRWIQSLILSLIAIFLPIKSLLLTSASMILIDLISGVIAARKQNIPVTSAGLRRSISKLFVYESAIMLAFLVETYMSDVVPFVKIASAMVSLVELTSVYENINIIGGNNLLKSLIDKLGSANQKDRD